MIQHLQAASTRGFDADVLQSVVLVDFWAPWCVACRALDPILEDMAAAYEGRVGIYKVNIDEEPDLRQRFAISGIPALILFVDGTPTRLRDVKSRAALRAVLDGALGQTSARPAEIAMETAAEDGLLARLDRIWGQIELQLGEAGAGLPDAFGTARAIGGDVGAALNAYYLWLLEDHVWGMASYVKDDQERAFLQRLKALQTHDLAGVFNRDDWLELAHEVQAYVSEPGPAHDRVDVGIALIPLSDLAHFSIDDFHGYVESLARRSTASASEPDSAREIKARAFALAAGRQLVASFQAGRS
jgi:thioredoxin 1